MHQVSFVPKITSNYQNFRKSLAKLLQWNDTVVSNRLKLALILNELQISNRFASPAPLSIIHRK